MSRTIEIGQNFGRLTVETRPERRSGNNYLGCVCTCGEKRFVAVASLAAGRQRSCGCLTREVAALLRQNQPDGSPKYGALVEYRAWSNAQQKCSNPRSAAYARNGGRGIKLCPEWRYDFTRFFADMGRCPDRSSLVRLNPDKDFSIENCRWSKSKRGQVYEYRGQRRTASSWATTLGIPLGLILDALEDNQTLAQIHDDHQRSLTQAA
jgi:hypothetical protein